MFGRGLAAAGRAARALAVATGGASAEVEVTRQACARAAAGGWLRGFASNSIDSFNVHKDFDGKNTGTEKWDYTEANRKIVDNMLSKYPTNWRQSAMIPMLDIAQQQSGGWLPLSAMNRVAEILGVPEIRVYEVATFYSMFNRTPGGKYHVMVCGTTPCRLQGAQSIEHTISEHLGINMGETTSDGMFTLAEMECMGACVNAPMVCIADFSNGVEGFSYEYYEDLTQDDMRKILDQIKRGEKPKTGSQYRSKAEPAGAIVNRGEKWVPMQGHTTLTGDPPGPRCRDLDAPPPPPPK
ncbi:unnamed protein product [Pedinophyceae sp. YPF-701]|nr:unnamed protein product [Pedinophyceae sp. YPF-701]